MIPDTILRLAINRLSVLRPSEKQMLEELVDSEDFFRALTPSLLSGVVGRSIERMDAAPETLLVQAERDLSFLRSRECTILSLWDRRYPAVLREIYDPPYLLYVRGELPALAVPSIAIVGTRQPTAGAVIAAREIAGELAAAGVPVISGLARGIDAAAHQGALDRGVTGAVLASGVDLITPSSNRALAAALLDRGGFLVSEYGPGVVPRKYHFPARNRIISGLSRAVVVVQAPARSGALITADYALDQGRDLFVHRDCLDGPTGAGSADLAADGAQIVACAAEILEELGIRYAPRESAPCVRPGAGDAQTTDDAARIRAEAVRRLLYGEVAR